MTMKKALKSFGMFVMLLLISNGCTYAPWNYEEEPVRHLIKRDANGEIIRSQQLSDAELDLQYARGVYFKFYNTDVKNAEALQYLEDLLVDIETKTGINPFLANYTVEVWGATYREGVVPLTFDANGKDVTINLPNKIDLIVIEPEEGSWADIGTIVIKNYEGDITLRITYH